MENRGEHRGGEEAVNRAIWAVRRPSRAMRCARCDSRELSTIRTFATGNGTVFRTLIEDVYCLVCGYMGQPDFKIDE